MKTLCITGLDHPALGAVTAPLFAAGLAAAKPVVREQNLDIHTWHEKVVAKLQQGGNAAHIGRLWEQLAGDIFMANLDAPIWGWVSPHSAEMLDFWLQFDPHLYFVLSCVSPLDALAHAIANPADTRPPETVLQQWQAQHQTMLRFYLRHPERSLLTSAVQGLQQPAAFVAHINTQWSLGLDASRIGAPDHAASTIHTDAVARHLARELLHNFTEATALWHEIEASAVAIAPQSAAQQADIENGNDDAADIIAAYRQLRDRSQELLQVQAIRDELVATRITLTHQLSQANTELSSVSQARDEHARLSTERKAQLDQLNKEKAELAQQRDTLKADLQKQQAASQSTATELADTKAEADLLLQQLHQVQEELETIFLKEQETAKQRDTHKAELAAAAKARDEQTKLATERKTQLDQLTKEKTELTKQRDTHKAELAAATKARDEQTKLAAERKTLLDQLTKEKTELTQQRDTLKADLQKQQAASQATATELADTKEEADLLLQQLHQVQEELETIFLKEQETAKQRDTHKAELAAAAKARDEQTKLATERKTQLDQLTKEKTELTKQRDTHKAELAAATKARDEQTKLAAERKTLLDQLTKEKTELTKQRDAHKAELAAIAQTRDALKADLQKQHAASQATAAELADTKEEADLLLQQLHQVQEELEHYFLEHRAALQLADEREARWQRMVQRYPGYFLFQGLRSTPDSAGNALHWQMNGLDTARRSLSNLKFETLLQRDCAAFRFTNPTGEDGPLLRWPDHKATEIILNPATDEDDFVRLSASDFTLLQTLATSLGRTLANPASLGLPPEFTAAPHQQALLQLAQRLAALPPTLRFDEVQLKSNQVIPGYEHLWLRIDNLTLGAQHWPQFEFRLACADVEPDRFGTHPKLELPQDVGQAPLPGWFEESDDEHGAKLELRFALPEAMDLQIWNQLGDADRHFLRALIDALPGLLATLQASGAQISRAWQDWFKLADDSRRILALRAPVANAADAPLQ